MSSFLSKKVNFQKNSIIVARIQQNTAAVAAAERTECILGVKNLFAEDLLQSWKLK